ncbi:MAG: WD40 repeat domain-containing protein [Chloroflexota bacterium]
MIATVRIMCRVVIAIVLCSAAPAAAASNHCLFVTAPGNPENWITNVESGMTFTVEKSNFINLVDAVSPDHTTMVYESSNPGDNSGDGSGQLFVQSGLDAPIELESKIPNNRGANVWFMWSPDSQKFVYTFVSGSMSQGTGKVIVAEANKFGQRTIIQSYNAALKPLWNDAPFLETELLGWSPDSQYMAYFHYTTKNTELAIWSASQKKVTSLNLSALDDPYDGRFIGQHWQGHKLAFVHDRKLIIIDADTAGYVLPPVDLPDSGIENLIWSPDGRYIAILSGDPTLGSLDILDLQAKKYLPQDHVTLSSLLAQPEYCGDCFYPDFEIEPIVWAADSHAVYVIQGEYDYDKPATLAELDVSTGNLKPLLTGIKFAHWLLPAQWLAFTSANNDHVSWYDIKTDEQHLITDVPIHDDSKWNVILSPDHLHTALIIRPFSGDVTLYMFALAPLPAKQLNMIRFAPSASFDWSLDSKYIAVTVTKDGTESAFIVGVTVYNADGEHVRDYSFPALNEGHSYWASCPTITM